MNLSIVVPTAPWRSPKRCLKEQLGKAVRIRMLDVG